MYFIAFRGAGQNTHGVCRRVFLCGFLGGNNQGNQSVGGGVAVFLDQLMFRNGVGGEDARKGCIVGVYIRKTTISVSHRGDGGCFAEVVGFEPTVPLDTPVFKTGAIVRSATLPCAWS